MTTVWKLTRADLTTYGGYRWSPGVSLETSGQGELCTPGFIHAYTHPALALLLNPIHADFPTPRLWQAEGVVTKTDYGLKVGCTSLVLRREILPVPEISVEQHVIFAISCALKVARNPAWIAWAEAWLRGEQAARARGAAARAVRATPEAATEAADAAARSAEVWVAWAAEAASVVTAARTVVAVAAAWAATGAAARAAEAASELNLIEVAVTATRPIQWPDGSNN